MLSKTLEEMRQRLLDHVFTPSEKAHAQTWCETWLISAIEEDLVDRQDIVDCVNACCKALKGKPYPQVFHQWSDLPDPSVGRDR